MTFKTSDAGIALIKQFEGVRLKAYKCPAGVWTIGYGSTRWNDDENVEEGDHVGLEGAEKLLKRDLEHFEYAVNKLVTAEITQNQFDALISFVYNVGEYALKKSTLLQQLNAGNTARAADEFLKWTKAAGKELPGLVKRRAAERALFLS